MQTQTITMRISQFLSLLVFTFITSGLFSQSNHGNKFEQLGTVLPQANNMRGIDGAPGPDYWQQQVNYNIKCTLDVNEQQLHGEETIVYINNSPNTLRYLWLQLDENQHSILNDNQYSHSSSIEGTMNENAMRALDSWREKEKYGVNIEQVVDENGNALKYTINQTMMRLELLQPIKSGEKFKFGVKWNYFLVDRIDFQNLQGQSHDATSLARGGYEYFEEDGNYLFTMSQWYPRLCAYTDAEGWQNNQFTGRGEFALTFGDFDVEITVPDDHIVGSTGECQNYQEMLSEEAFERWAQAQSSDEPIEIITLSDAEENQSRKVSNTTQTWKYHAENVRDFAWTASKKFIWDALAYETTAGKKVMCMSYYPKEAYPIYNTYSTKAVRHTLDVYSRYSIPYPYPVAISVEAASGMEYPMICFNPGRAEPDGTYSQASKNLAISVIIHEVGHNYYPMIINSDERQWAWFDEGLNSFVQYIAESEWDNNYPSWFGPARQIVPYMSMPDNYLEPIMTNSENIADYFQNAYSKPAAGLNILRETIMGRELFDYAFAEYGRRWAFKNPTPADFFRTMEDASGIDLDWFWRGWFYSIDRVDISLDSIIWYKVDLNNNPEKQEKEQFAHEAPLPDDITRTHNRESEMKFVVDEDKSLQDFYSNYKPWETKDSSISVSNTLYGETFSKKEKRQKFGDKNYYELQFSNKGGLVMPVIIEWTYEDGTTEIERIPVEIWRINENNFTKVFVKDKVVTGIIIDPFEETADVDRTNNTWPVKQVPTQFQVYKKHKMGKMPNGMQRNSGKS